MACREKPVSTIRSEHPDLHDKLRRMPVKTILSRDAILTREDLLSGLKSSSKHEFLARCLVTSRSFNALLNNISDPEVGEAIISLGDDGGRLAGNLAKTLAGAVGRLPRHPLRDGRVAELLTKPQGKTTLASLLSTEGGSHAASEMFSDPAGAEILDRVHTLGGHRSLSAILYAKTAGHRPRPRESVRLLWPKAKPVTSKLLLEEPTDQEISSRLTAGVGSVRYSAIAELFSSDGKLNSFIRYTGDGGNAAYVAHLIREKPVRSQLAIFDILKTDGGPGRLATAISKRPAIIVNLAADPVGREIIYSVYNAPPRESGGRGAGQELMDEIGRHGGQEAAASILHAITQARLQKMTAERGDIPLNRPLDKAEDILRERQ